MLTDPSEQEALCALEDPVEKHYRGESRGHEGRQNRACMCFLQRVRGGRAEQAQGWVVYRVMSGSGRGSSLITCFCRGIRAEDTHVSI